MDGLEGATRLVVDRLRDALPGKTTGLRARYGVDPATGGHLLPDVVTVAGYDTVQLGLEDYPAVLVEGLGAPSMRRDTVTGGGQVWLVVYDVRVYVWVRGPVDAATTLLVRNRLVLAVRELLMQRRLLPGSAMVDDRSLTESYSDVAVDDTSQATLAGGYVQFQLQLVETLDDVDHPAHGPVEEAVLDTGVLPPHPSL